MSLGTVDTYLTRRHAHRVQREQSVPERDWAPVPAGSYTLLVLFNLMAAFDEGHAILAVGPAAGDLMTYSYYRRGNALRAPASVACLREPETFAALREASGWIVHGGPGDWWNEHVDCALALTAPADGGRAVAAYAEQVKANPGTYDLVTHNCLAFEAVAGAVGATPFRAWKYWFDDVPAPVDGLRTIGDDPGTERGDVPGPEA